MRHLALIALLALALLPGCGINHADVFPNLPEGSSIRTGIGNGPTAPTGPVSGHTSINPTGRR
jgi:hypothetical protein